MCPPQRFDVAKLISDIEHKKLQTAYQIAITCEQLVEKWISDTTWTTTQELMNIIKLAIKQMKEDLQHDVIATNIFRHMLKMIREEHEAGSEHSKGENQSLHQIVTALHPHRDLDYSESVSNLRTRLLDNFQEFKMELESSSENIASQALEHIHDNDIILTVGRSETVLNFLRNAAQKRQFQVIVVEGGPDYQGHEMTKCLIKSKIRTTLISDCAAFATMSRVNKVIIGTYSILADGGLCAISGIHTIALSAKYYSVPVLVLSHLFKLTPTYIVPNAEDGIFNAFSSPAGILPYHSAPIGSNCKILNPLFDYVPPELVTLFICHQGGNSPSYVYRLLSELYHPNDYDL